jgi:hypothetical protein
LLDFVCIFAGRNFLTGQRFEEKTIYGIEEMVFYTSLAIIIAF